MVAILATIAGLAISSYGGGDDGVEGQARDGITRTELATLQQALVRFHRDTGWLPGQGPFDLVSSPLGKVPVENLPAFVPTALGREWLLHPANLWALFVNPLRDPDGSGTAPLPDPLGQWDPVRRRGWNGPYLPLVASGLCVVPDVPLGWDGRTLAWDPMVVLGGSSPVPVHAVHDPYGRGVTEASGAYTWYGFDYPASTGHFLGHPYLLLEPANRSLARVVSLGSDGLHARAPLSPGFVSGADLLAVEPTSDDVGRFVHR